MIESVAAVTVKPVAGFVRGFSYPLRAAKFLVKKPGLLKYMAIPFAINLLVFSLSVYFGLDMFERLLAAYAPSPEVWYGMILYYLAWIVAMLLTTVVVFFSFTVIGNLIASPFNELLSERTEALKIGNSAEEKFSAARFLADAKNALFVEVKKMTVFISGMLLLLTINLIPGIGSVIYALLAPLFTLFFLVVEYLAFVLMRKQLSFADQRRYVSKRPVMMLGFGCGVFCLLAIPFLQFFCIPLAVVGATLLWCDFPREEV
jgi:CysZ protein